jgi:hypothetical protein
MSDTDTKIQPPAIKVISPTTHGVLDYLVVAIFLIAPSVLGLTGVFAYGAYGLAAAHFLLTVTTDFASGLFPVLSLRIHALFELLVSLGMVVSPWIFGFSGDPIARNFFLGFGILIFAVWLATDYGLWVDEGRSDVSSGSDVSKSTDEGSEDKQKTSDSSPKQSNQ